MTESTSESLTADRGFPTAVTGNETAVKKRFNILQGFVSLRNKTVLDIGCGFGAYSKFALDLGAKRVASLDMSHKYLLNALVIDRIQASGITIPFQDSCFDVALLIEVLDHLPFEKKALDEISRVLRPGGFIIVSVPNKFYPLETHGMRILSTDIQNILGIGIPFLSWIPHSIRKHFERARIYTQKELVHLLVSSGFHTLKIDYLMPALDEKLFELLAIDGLRTSLKRLLTNIERTNLRYLGCHILIIAKLKK
jgi:SAM-dependent methyltransferase